MFLHLQYRAIITVLLPSLRTGKYYGKIIYLCYDYLSCSLEKRAEILHLEKLMITETIYFYIWIYVLVTRVTVYLCFFFQGAMKLRIIYKKTKTWLYGFEHLPIP